MVRVHRIVSHLVVLAAAASCGSGEQTDGSLPSPSSVCEAGFIGDPAREPLVELRSLAPDGTDVPLVDGGDIAVVTPPQGGRVSFVGVRAVNVDACGMQISTTLHDPVSGQSRVDARTVNLLRDGEGFGTSGAATTNIADYRELGSYSHLPLCPNRWAEQDVFDAPFDLDVRVVDRRGRSVETRLRVMPRCADAACRCLCKRGNVAGTTCP